MHDFPSFVDLLRERAAAHPDRLAFSFLQDGETETDRWTFAELDRRARAIAASLLERGLSKQRALLLYNPSLEFVSSFFGCLYANVQKRDLTNNNFINPWSYTKQLSS